MENGFTKTDMRMISLCRKQCEPFYEMELMVTQLQSGICLAMEIQRSLCGPAEPEVAKIIRPNTLRAHFGIDKILNAVHCTELRSIVRVYF